METKFKKGQQVSFVGNVNYAPLKQTYIHAIRNTGPDLPTYYLIQHPHGMSISANEEKEFSQGIEWNKLNKELRYLLVNEGQLNEIIIPIETVQATFPKPIWDVVVSATYMQYVNFTQNKALIMIQAGIDEEDYKKIIQNTEIALREFKALGLIETLDELGIK